jgi:O-antigen/teichoic acid export membrane protein
MLVALTKLLAPSLVGSFSLALAISTPFIFFANLNLRAILSSDVSGRNEFRDYLGVRILALGAASAAILLTTAVLYRDLPLFLVTCLVLVSKFFDSISDLIYGVLQKHERNAPIAKSRMIQGVTQFLAIFSVIFLTKNLLWGVTALAIVSALVTLLYDLPNAGKTLAEFPETPESSRRTALTPRFDRAITGPLLVLAFPLGLVYFLDQLMVNIPRVLLGTFASKSSVAVFAALSYVVVIGMTVVSAITESARPRLARQFREDRGAFLKLLGRLVAIGVGLGVAGIIFSAAVGKPALTLLYKREYGLHSDILVILMVSATFWFASSFLSAGIIAADNYRVMVPIFVAATIATTLSALYLVPNFGLAGAAWSLGVGMVARVGLSCYVLWVMLRHPLLGTPEAVVADNYSAE